MSPPAPTGQCQWIRKRVQMPKRDIRLSEAELQQFLAAHDECVIGFQDGSSAPNVGLGGYGYGGARQVATVAFDLLAGPNGPARSMADCLSAKPRVCVVVEQSPSYYEIAYVAVRGAVEQLAVHSDTVSFELEVHDVTTASFAKLLAVR